MGRVIPQRACDVCGELRAAATGVFRMIDKHWVCNRHPNFMTLERADREPYKTFGAKPLKDARPFQTVASHEMEEGVILSFLARFWNYQTVNEGFTAGGTGGNNVARSTDSSASDSVDVGDPSSAAWAAIYTAAIVQEDKAPYKTIALAKAILLQCADWLSTHQREGPNSGGSSANAVYGAWTSGGNNRVTIRIQAAGGVALLRAYQVFGTASYLTAAGAAMSQALLLCRSDAWNGTNGLTAPFTTRLNTPPGFYLWNVGGTYTVAASSAYCSPESLSYLEFFALYQSIAGDLTITNAATGYYTGTISAKVSEMASLLRAFWANPSPGAAPKIGLSSATPRDSFDGLTLAWRFSDDVEATGTTITSYLWAYAIRGLYAYEGTSAQVIDLFNFLMASTSNPTYELPAQTEGRVVTGYDQFGFYSTNRGDYAPATTGMIAFSLKVRETGTLAAVNRNESSSCTAWATGLMGAVYAARQGAAVEALKFNASQPVPRAYTTGPREIKGGRWLMLNTFTGLSYQFGGAATLAPIYAASFGLIYRHGIQSFPYRGHA
jgi:hypothetical protein